MRIRAVINGTIMGAYSRIQSSTVGPLQAKDTLGPTSVYCKEDVLFLEVSKCNYWGHYKVSFMRGCPFFRGYFIEGSTVLTKIEYSPSDVLSYMQGMHLHAINLAGFEDRILSYTWIYCTLQGSGK